MSVPASDRSGMIEAERQLAAAIERHREVTTSMHELGRSEAGQHVAVKAVGRAVQLVSFALERAAGAGVPFERLVELTGWEPDLVREGLELPVPELRFVARLAPAAPDPRAIARAAAAFEVIRRLQELTQHLLADVDEAADTPLSANPTELDRLHEQAEAAWRAWRHDLGHEGP